MYVLFVDSKRDYYEPEAHGPFDSYQEAEEYAENLRQSYEITKDDDAFVFAILQPRKFDAGLRG